MKLPEQRIYKRRNCITFRKTNEKFGGLSNMAGGYPLLINNVRILTSEALYQACRFPHLPEVQQLIIAQRSPMTAKMKSKPYRSNSRPDWDVVRTKIMRWCLQVKLVQNWEKFSRLLLDTGDLPIVEDSRKDDFWGAKPQDEEILAGANVLGRLLMQLREQVEKQEITNKTIVPPLPIPDFLLLGHKIRPVSASGESYFSQENLNKNNKFSNQLESKFAYFENPPQPSNGNNDLKEKLSEESDNEFEKHDAFYIMLPHIEKMLETERTDKELAKVFNVPVKLMHSWLERAVKLGRAKKLSKPVRYVVQIQLSLSLTENS